MMKKKNSPSTTYTKKLLMWPLLFVTLFVSFILIMSTNNQSDTTLPPTTSPIINYNNYVNSKYSFSFQCPQPLNLQVFESDGSDGNSIRDAESKIFVGVPNSDRIYLEVFIYRSSLSPESWWDNVGSEKYSKALVSQTSRRNLAGKESLSIKLTEQHSESADELELKVIAQNGLIYLVEISTSNKEALKVSNEIISTFALTNN